MALVVPRVLNDAVVVVFAVVMGVFMRAAVIRLQRGLESAPTYPFALQAAAFGDFQAWSAAVGVLVGTGLLTWVVSETRAVGSAIEPMSRMASDIYMPADGKVAVKEVAAQDVWDPLELLDGKQQRRSLEVKHGHLTLLANAGLVGVRQCSTSSQSTDAGSSCSTESAELLSDSAESCASESTSDLDASVQPLERCRAAESDIEESRCVSHTGCGLTRQEAEHSSLTQQSEGAVGQCSAHLQCCLCRLASRDEDCTERVTDIAAQPQRYDAASPQLLPSPRSAPQNVSVQGMPEESAQGATATAAGQGVDEPLFSLPRGSLWSDCPEDDLPLATAPEHPTTEHPEVSSSLFGPDAAVPALERSVWSSKEASELESPPGHQFAQLVSSQHRELQERNATAFSLPPKTLELSACAPIDDSHMSEGSTALQGETPEELPPKVTNRKGSCFSRGPAFQKPRKNPADKDVPMQEILHTLERVDQDRVLIVRKIKKLGFNSMSTLRAHFEQFGLVQQILVSHSHLQSRVRPASLGFVVMDSIVASKAALAVGSEQVVRDHTIFVGAFEQLDRKEQAS